MSTLSLACKLEDLKQLDNKPYIKFQTHLLNQLLDMLPRTLAVTYEKLYIQQKTDKRHSRGVIMSQKQIGKLIRRHEDTAQRHLKQLESFGCIRKTLSKHSKGLYRNQLCYEVVAPEEVLENIKNNVLDISEIRRKQGNLYKNITAKTQADPDETAGYINNNRNNPKAYIKTNIREESLLDNLEPVDEALEYPLEYQLQNESVEQNVPRETFLEEPQGEVARFITKAERKQIVTKVKAMKRDGEIHPKVQANYQDIMVLVQHIIIHCVYRNVLRYKNFKHALNSAADGLRNGTWTTPKRVLREETLERERLHNEAKEKEKQLILSSGIGRSLGNALRAQNGPSEVDLARVKAGILEQGIRELGPNPRKQDIDKLKAIIQKTVEDKWKERK